MTYDYPQFWTQLLQRVRVKTKLHSHLSPRRRNWLEMRVGPGLMLSYLVREHEAAVALYIDGGPGTEAENLRLFNSLLNFQAMIEDDYGAPLLWEPLDGRRACRIQSVLTVGGIADQERWTEIHSAMVEAMIRFEAALRSRLPASHPTKQ